MLDSDGIGGGAGGAESWVKMLVLHVEAAGGTQERLAGTVCAVTFQAFRRLRGACGRKKSEMSPKQASSLMRRSRSLAATRERMLQREAEQTGKPTYPSYSSMPIEQASGPNAAQREAVRRDRDGRNRGVLGDRKAREQTG